MAAAFIAFAGAVQPAGAGKFGDVVTATVAPGSQVSPRGNFYLVAATPGDTVTQHVVVSNPNDHAVTVNVEAVDASTAPTTGLQLAQPGSAKALTSRWIVVATPQVTLAPSEQRDVPFTIHVPTGLKPGQYLAGISASVPLASDGGAAARAASRQAGFAMAVQFQRGIAVEVDIAGPRAPTLTVTGAEPKAAPGGVVLGVHMANTGNAFAHGTGVIRVPDTGTDFSFKISTFVPGTAIVYPMQWTKAVVPGTHHVEVDLTYEGGRRTTWNGTVIIAGDTQNQLEGALRNVTVGAHGSGVSPLLILAVALFVMFLAAAIVMRRRSRGPRPVNYRAA